MAGPTTTDYILAGLITGTTVMFMHGILEGIFVFTGYSSPLIRMLIQALVSTASGYISIVIVAATNLLSSS